MTSLKFPKNLFTRIDVLTFRRKELAPDLPWILSETESDYILTLKIKVAV